MSEFFDLFAERTTTSTVTMQCETVEGWTPEAVMEAINDGTVHHICVNKRAAVGHYEHGKTIVVAWIEYEDSEEWNEDTGEWNLGDVYETEEEAA